MYAKKLHYFVNGCVCCVTYFKDSLCSWSINLLMNSILKVLLHLLIITSLVHLSAAILKNEIGWFDDTNNTSSMLSSQLETDATLLRTIVVDRSTILLQNIGLVVASFIVAFILNWRITLVVIATYPLIISGHISEVRFLAPHFNIMELAYLFAF